MPRTDQPHSDYALAIIGHVLRKGDIELKGISKFWRASTARPSFSNARQLK
jgi:hypothetical protein